MEQYIIPFMPAFTSGLCVMHPELL